MSLFPPSGTSIRQSVLSYLWTFGAAGGAGLTLTYGGALWFPVVTIGFFGLLGMGLSLDAPKFDDRATEESVEPKTESVKTFPKMAMGVAGALFSFMLLYWVLNPIVFSSTGVTYTAWFSVLQLPTANAAQTQATFFFLVFTVPWGEESFFRGAWGNLFARYLPGGFAELAAGSIFAVFHAAVYSLFLGPNWPLIGLLTGAGAVFTFVDLETGDIATSMVAHGAYNGLAFAVQGSVLGFILPAVGRGRSPRGDSGRGRGAEVDGGRGRAPDAVDVGVADGAG